MAIKKRIGFQTPYISRSFQELVSGLVGTSGYLEGAICTDDLVNITVGPYKFVQNGIVVESDANVLVPLPTSLSYGPVYVLASTADDDDATGVTLLATQDLSRVNVGEQVVLAYRTNQRWDNPPALRLGELRDSTSPEVGLESGGGLYFEPGLSTIWPRRATVIDHDGRRRSIASKDEAVKLVGTDAGTPAKTAPGMTRLDASILRRRSRGVAENIRIIGNTRPREAPQPTYVPATLENAAGTTRPSFFAVRRIAPTGAGVVDRGEFFAWSSGADLKVAANFAGAGIFNNVTVLTGAGTLSSVSIVGMNADDHLIIVYIDNGDVRACLADSTTGALVGAAVTIDTQPDVCSAVRAAMRQPQPDPYSMGDDIVHVVYEHLEGGGPRKQVYFARFDSRTATFGNLYGTANFFTGADNTFHDVDPSVGVDSRGYAHIACTTDISGGTASTGQLRYALIDNTGAVVTTTITSVAGKGGGYASTATAGEFPTEYENGIAADAITSISLPIMVVTPHDEPYVVSRAVDGGLTRLSLWAPHFAQQYYYEFININGVHRDLGASTTMATHSAYCDEWGHLIIGALYGAAWRIGRLTLPFAPDGRLDQSIGYISDTLLGVTDAVTSRNLNMGRNGVGQCVLAYLSGTSVKYVRVHELDAYDRVVVHPDDILLGTLQVDDTTGASIDATELSMRAFSVRPKKMNYPVLVGNDGDYQGFSGLQDAVSVIRKHGGHVVLRGGEYRIVDPIILRGGMLIESERHATLRVIGTNTGVAAISSSALFGTCAVAANVVTFTSQSTTAARVGDILALDTSGVHRILHILDQTRVIVEGTPAGANYTLYRTGIRLRGLQIHFDSAPTAPLRAAFSFADTWGAELTDISISGNLTDTVGVLYSFCRRMVIDGLDFDGVTASGGGTITVSTGNGQDNIFRRMRMSLSGFPVQIAQTEVRPTFENCVGIVGVDSVSLLGVRTAGDYVRFINCQDFEIGGAQEAFALTHTANTEPDLASVRTLGTTKPYLEARADRFRVASPVSDNEVPLSITAHATQRKAISRIVGRNSLEPMMWQPHGVLVHRGLHFYDDFSEVNAQSAPGGPAGGAADGRHRWEHIDAGIGGGTWDLDNVAFSSTVTLAAAAGVNNAITLLARRASYTRSRNPGFWTRLLIAGVSGGTYEVGFDSHLYFSIDLTVNPSPVTIIHYDSANALQAPIATGVTIPHGGGYRYLWLQVISTTQFLWKIATSDDSWDNTDNITVQTATGTGSLANLAWRPFLKTTDTAGVGTGLVYVDFVECWSSGR